MRVSDRTIITTIELCTYFFVVVVGGGSCVVVGGVVVGGVVIFFKFLVIQGTNFATFV